MPSLRAMIDGQIVVNSRKPELEPLKVKDQVVMRRQVGRGLKAVREVMAGTIVSLSEDKLRAVVSLPRSGGRMLRTTIAVDQLQPASAVFKRHAVNVNPALRQIFTGRV